MDEIEPLKCLQRQHGAQSLPQIYLIKHNFFFPESSHWESMHFTATLVTAHEVKITGCLSLYMQEMLKKFNKSSLVELVIG